MVAQRLAHEVVEIGVRPAVVEDVREDEPERGVGGDLPGEDQPEEQVVQLVAGDLRGNPVAQLRREPAAAVA